MRDENLNPLEDTESEAALAYAEERRENIRTFVRTSPDYYIRNFDRIGAFVFSFRFEIDARCQNRQIISVMMPKIVNPSVPKIGIMYCAPETTTMSSTR